MGITVVTLVHYSRFVGVVGVCFIIEFIQIVVLNNQITSLFLLFRKK